MYCQSKENARRYLLAYHGLLNENEYAQTTGIMDFIRKVGCIQFDPIDVCGRNADLTLQSRIRDYKKHWLEKLLYEDRMLIDYFDKNLSIMPVSDWPLMSRRREYYRNESRSSEVTDRHEQMIMDYLQKNDFACSKDFDLKERADWYWSSSSSARVVLETLYFRGDLVIHHKKGTIKYYTRRDRLFDSELSDYVMSDDDHDDLFVYRRIKSVGMLWNKPSDAFLGIMDLKAARRKAAFERLCAQHKITEVSVEGIKEPLYIPSENLSLFTRQHEIITSRTEFLAPLDNMLWDRKLISALFGFDYKWEIYEPQHRRKYGYYVLPVIQNDGFVGRIEVVHQKKTKTLKVERFWQESGFDMDSLKQCIERFARFHQAKHIDFGSDWHITSDEPSGSL